MRNSRNLPSEVILLVIYALVWAVVPLYALFSPYILYSHGLTLLNIGLFSTLYNVASLIGQFSMGYLSDIIRSRRRLVIIDLTLIIAVTTLITLRTTVTYYIAASLIMGFLAGGFSTLMLAASSELTTTRLGRSISIVRIGGAIGWIGGSLVMPLVMLTSSLKYAALLALMISIAALIIALRGLRETYSLSFRARLTLGTWSTLSIYSLIAGIVISSASWFLPIYIFIIHGSILYLGEIIAAGAAMEVPVMLLTGRLFDSSLIFRRYLFLINGVVLSSAFILYTQLPLGALFAAQMIRGMGYALFIVSTPALLMSLGVERGKGSAAFFTSFSMGSVLGGVIGGALSTIIGVRDLFIVLSLAFLITSALINALVTMGVKVASIAK